MRLLLGLTAAVVVVIHALPAHAASVDGVNIHWTSHGAGPKTLILVHCAGCDGTSWSEQVLGLSRSYRVITLDLPGHGRSGIPAAFSMDLFVRAVDAVRSEAGADRVVLAGHTTGALVIRRYALTHPEHVAGLVLVEGQLLMTDGKGRSNAPPERWLRQLSVDGGRADTIHNTLRGTTSPALQERILTMMLGVREDVAVETWVALYQPSEANNEKITLPVLSVYGTGVATEGAVKLLYPRAEYHRLQDAGHFPMMAAPDAFNGLVDDFLARLTF